MFRVSSNEVFSFVRNIYVLSCQMPSSNAPIIGLRTRFTFFPDKKQSWCVKAKCGSLYDDQHSQF
uniref:Putative ovule protein n=1 Tax=Solanum chacoense TaxID=4108 RepID=A0A0V0GSF9_SOLCH